VSHVSYLRRINSLENLEWGSHCCHLYRTRDDLVGMIVRFFAAGLENNERCLWVTAEPLETEVATRELAKRVPDLQSKIERGQLRMVTHSDWYGRTGRLDAKSGLAAWIAAEESARADGYAGVRAMGHRSFIKTREEWRELQEYELRLSETFAGRRIVALCSYDLGALEASDVLDVVRDHHFAVVRCDREYEVIANAAAKPKLDSLTSPQTQVEERLRERIAELERTLHQQERAGRAKDEFLAMLGHELRNPLAPMTTALQLMRLRGVESREQEILDRQLTHLTRLVDDLLDVSRITHGRIELRKRPVELSQIVIRAIEVVSPLLEQRQQRINVQVPREGLLIAADLERMAQVLGNLLTNASKYSDPRSRILVYASREGTNIRCSVKDEGIGIAPEMLQDVFEPFVQQPQTLERSRGGLGLGLAIVRRLVVQHGGVVRAQSDGPGRGSEFIIELPALENGNGAQGLIPAAEEATEAADTTSIESVDCFDDYVGPTG
jgi:signal transduction histidine kinase